MVSLYTSLVSKLIFPLHERLKGHDSPAILRSLEESQWWPRNRLLEFQLARLRGLMRHAFAHVPYYRSALNQAAMTPEDFRSLADLARLPLLTKALIRKHTEELKSNDAAKLMRFNTGGSSGEPLIFYMGSERVSHDVAAKWRATRWWGVDIGDPEIVVWGSPIELGAQDWVRLARDRILRTRLLPAFEMSSSELDHFVQTIRKVRPAMLFGYPSSLALIANHARKQGITLDRLGIKVAFVTSERLYDEQRSEIASTFGCRVANGYGGRDAGFIAHECPQGGMHITSEDIIVEIVGSDGQVLPPGQAGEVVVTHLATGDFPFVRYRTGDIGVLSQETCSCGRGLPLLQEVQGRTTDFVVAKDGTIMHGLALIYVIRDIPGVEKFKIIQESLDRTRVLLVTNDGFNPAHVKKIKHDLLQRLGQDVKLDIALVEDIPQEVSGKYRYVTSHVPVF